MNRITRLLTALLVFSLEASAQDTLRFKLTSSGKPTTNPDSVFYTRKAWKEGGLWQVRDFYYPDGTRQMKGSYLDARLEIKQGSFTYYTSDGELSSEGRYERDKKEGLWKGWWWQSGGLDYENSYRNGELHGTARWYHGNGQLSEESVYEDGELISARFWDKSGKPQADGTSEIRLPSFSGGQPALYAYLSKNLQYPKSARRAAEQGKAIIQFIVEPDGKIDEFSIARSSGSKALDEEAVRVIRAMPPWIPGTYHNRIVRTIFRQPVTFRLE